MLLKVIVNVVLSATIGILITGVNFKILFVMVFLVWRCCVLILAILLLSLLKVLIMVVLFMTLTNQMWSVCWKILYFRIVDIYKMHAKEINIKNRVDSCHFDYLTKGKKIETKRFQSLRKTIRIWSFISKDIIEGNQQEY